MKTLKEGLFRFPYRVVARTAAPRDPLKLFTYDEKGRREYASGLTRREALSLLSQARGADVVIEKYAGHFEGMAIWKPIGVKKRWTV